MNPEETIMELEKKEASLTVQLIEGVKQGAADHGISRELEEVRAKLKVARRIRTMEAKRIEPKLTRKISLLLSEKEYETILRKADGMDLSKYIRYLIKKDV